MIPLRTIPLARLDFIDALRGLAALYVVVFHLAFVGHVPPPMWAAPVVGLGATGVTLFFLVSAFSLCLSSARLLSLPDGDRVFYLRRFFRIAPLFYVVLALTLMRDAWLLGAYHRAPEILENVTFTFNAVAAHNPGLYSQANWGIPDGGWTIGVEMLFYAVFPAIFRATRTPWRLGLAMILAIGLAKILPAMLGFLPMDEALRSNYVHSSILGQLQVFVIGIAVFDIYQALAGRLAGGGRGRWLGLAAILAGLGAGYCLAYGGALAPFAAPGLVAQSLIYASFMLGFGFFPARLLVNRVSGYIGRISFSLYLFHSPVIQLLAPVYRRVMAQGGPQTWQFAAALVLTLGLLVPLAALGYRVIEAPGMALGRVVIRRLNPRRTTPE